MNRRYRRAQPTAPLWVRTAIVILIIFFLFLAAVAIFRRRGPVDQATVRTSDDIVAELTQNSAREGEGSENQTPRGIPESTTLNAVSSGDGRAVAKRVFENQFFTHTILAQDLPPIDESQFHYQAWLIRPYPFDFFETSSLVHNVDGSWGMIWVGEHGESYDDFVNVLVTREPNGDFDENPSADQVLEGGF